MTIEYFNSKEENLFRRVNMLKEMVGEQALYEGPCPLLASQLNELSVLCERLLADVRKLAKSVSDRMFDE